MKKNSKKVNNFLEKVRNKFKNKFDYSKMKYSDSQTPIDILCNEHLIYFKQTPIEHLRGYKKCVLCGGKVTNLEEFLIKAKNTHGDKYSYSKTVYNGSENKLIITCPKHGDFEQLPNGHYKSGCQKCHLESKNVKETLTDFLVKSENTHGNKYDYNKVNYLDSKTKVTITCPIHGEFKQQPYNHIRGKGCPSCGIESTKVKLTLSNAEFIIKANLVHNNKYTYKSGDYVNMINKYNVTCPKHGDFEQLPYDHLSGHGCAKCVSIISNQEIEINKFINSLGVDTITSNRSIILGKELDIYIPSKKIAIEFDGLYWHSEEFLNKDYHLNKTQLCEELGIQLIHIFEDEWVNTPEIVKSRLKNLLNLTENRIYGRTCIIDNITNLESIKFLNDNHLQGGINATHHIGLRYKGELVSLMLFNKPRLGIGQQKYDFELSRFCNKLNTNVIGGASKCLKHFIRENTPKEIVSYADRRWSNGRLYKTLGFEEIRINKPNYWYVINKNRKHRFGFRKNKLIKEGFDGNLTEREIMYNRGFNRIYDCGTITYKKTP